MVQRELFLEFAVWVRRTTLDGQAVVEVTTAPSTRRCFWLGQEAEQNEEASDDEALSNQEEDVGGGGDDHEEEEEPAPVTRRSKVLTVGASGSKKCVAGA